MGGVRQESGRGDFRESRAGAGLAQGLAAESHDFYRPLIN